VLNLARKKLLAPFFVCLAATLIMPALFPSIRLFYLSPFLVMTFYRMRYLKMLIAAFALGLFLDVFSLENRLGLMGLVLVITSGLIYPLKKYFFADKFYTLPLLTYLFGFAFTVIQTFFMEPLGYALFTEAIIMPLGDALFAFTVFVLPSLLYKAAQKILAVQRLQSEDQTA
jgi:hypothetical protein